MAQLRKLMEDYTTKYFGVDPSTWTDFEYNKTTTNPNTIISTDITIPLCAVTLYCISLPLLQIFMKNRKAPNVKYILFIHNIFLSLMSLYLTLFMTSTVLSYTEIPTNKSYYYIFCQLTVSEQNGTLNWLYYINLLVKYYELIDTVFLVIKKKPVTFLHGYHHPATLVFAWIIIMESTGMEWTVLVLNLIVHTIMYFYYAMSSIKIKMPGKQIITILQIIQFILDLTFVWYNMWEINFGAKLCNASNVPGYIATGILGSYLLLFMDFFKTTYCKKKEDNSKEHEKENAKKLKNGKHRNGEHKNGKIKNGKKMRNGINHKKEQ